MDLLRHVAISVQPLNQRHSTNEARGHSSQHRRAALGNGHRHDHLAQWRESGEVFRRSRCRDRRDQSKSMTAGQVAQRLVDANQGPAERRRRKPGRDDHYIHRQVSSCQSALAAANLTSQTRVPRKSGCRKGTLRSRYSPHTQR